MPNYTPEVLKTDVISILQSLDMNPQDFELSISPSWTKNNFEKFNLVLYYPKKLSIKADLTNAIKSNKHIDQLTFSAK